ncbi:MAG: hypothetical protein P1V21_15070 [Rhizobiaceae bacterium]|nr:hypothetical protein [Rhizobiaceae bacterium]
MDIPIRTVHDVRDVPARSWRFYFRKINKLAVTNPGAGCLRFDFDRAKGYFMQLPSILQGESLTRLLQGIAVGAIASMVIGFGWGGWMLGGTAEKQSADNAKSAVIAVLAPICADNFQNANNATTNLENLKKETSYQQASFVEKGGWAILPGNDKSSSGVARACASILNDLK